MCRFDFSSENQNTISYESSIVVGPSYYYCSLDIPASSLDAENTWGLTVYNVTESGYRASSTTEITTPQ